jgi:chromosome segregation ATPase
MNMSDTLIGVSMPEKGVSQIISLDFKRRESEQLALKVN